MFSIAIGVAAVTNLVGFCYSMAASINICQDTVGLLVICSDIISDEQQNELISYLDKALKRIDKNKFATIETIFNNLLAKNDFEAGMTTLDDSFEKRNSSSRFSISTDYRY